MHRSLVLNPTGFGTASPNVQIYRCYRLSMIFNTDDTKNPSETSASGNLPCETKPAPSAHLQTDSHACEAQLLFPFPFPSTGGKSAGNPLQGKIPNLACKRNVAPFHDPPVAACCKSRSSSPHALACSAVWCACASANSRSTADISAERSF
jgi:hypothetical protein